MYHDLEAVRPNAPGSLRSWKGKNDTLSRKTKCCIFMHIILRPFMISSGCHFNRTARFRMKCRSNALALCAVALTFLTQGRGSHRYVSMSPTGSAQNEYFRTPQRSHWRSASSTSSHLEQNCCKESRLGTCRVALPSEYLCSVSSQNR